MLYSIIFPAVVLVSVGALIFILGRKILTITPEEKGRLESAKEIGGESVKRGFFDTLNKIGLWIVEKFLFLIRVLVQKIYQTLSGWAKSIGNKKKTGAEDGEGGAIEIVKLDENKEIIQKQQTVSGRNYEEETEKTGKMERFFRRNKKKEEKIAAVATDSVVKAIEDEENVKRPLLEDRVTVPDSQEEEKSLEDILIDRISLDPRDVEAYERLGDYYIEKEDYKEAKECFKHVMKLAPSNDSVKIKIRRLERLLMRRM